MKIEKYGKVIVFMKDDKPTVLVDGFTFDAEPGETLFGEARDAAIAWARMALQPDVQPELDAG